MHKSMSNMVDDCLALPPSPLFRSLLLYFTPTHYSLSLTLSLSIPFWLTRAAETLMPCRHLCVCSSCSPTLAMCPLCRTAVAARLHVAPAAAPSEGEGGEDAAPEPE